MSCGMWSAVSSRVLPWPLHWNQELMLDGGPALPVSWWRIGWSCRYCCHRDLRFAETQRRLTLLPMFQVPTNTVIMSGSGFSECLFFICWSSWQKPSLFWWDTKQISGDLRFVSFPPCYQSLTWHLLLSLSLKGQILANTVKQPWTRGVSPLSGLFSESWIVFTWAACCVNDLCQNTCRHPAAVVSFPSRASTRPHTTDFASAVYGLPGKNSVRFVCVHVCI